MMENKEGKMECPECKGGMCSECGHMHGMSCNHCWRHGGYKFIRWIIGLIILAFVFGAGVKLGELKSMFYGSDGKYSLPGGYMMMWRGGQSGLENGYFGPAMMNLGGKNYQATTSTSK